MNIKSKSKLDKEEFIKYTNGSGYEQTNDRLSNDI